MIAVPGAAGEEKLFLARLSDLSKQAERDGKPRFTRFLDSAQAALCIRSFERSYENFMLCGGYEDAERLMCGIFPEYAEPDREAFPIKIVHFSSRMADKLSHRDYLGAILSQGLERDVVGDIAVCRDGAYVMVCEAAAETVLSIEKIGRVGVKAELVTDSSEVRSDEVPEEKVTTVSSLRLDVLTSACAGISRSKSAELIHRGLVNVSGVYSADVSYELKEGMKFSVRGFGKFQFQSIEGETKKNKIRIKLLMYRKAK